LLGIQCCLDVEDGSCVYLETSLHIAWPETGVIITDARRLRTVHYDQQRVLRIDDASALVAAGLASEVGGRLFEQPLLCNALFDWDTNAEMDFIERQLGVQLKQRRGVEFGCGTGRILLSLQARGFTLDGVDAAEPTITWLRQQLSRHGPADTQLVLADISACAFPGRYAYAIAGLNTLRYLPSVASLRRHLHLAALSVEVGGLYLIMVDSWTDGAAPAEAGSTGEWFTSADREGDRLRIVWTKVRHDPINKIDLESVRVYRGDEKIFSEHQTQLALSVTEWREIVSERGEWTVRSVHVDHHPAPVELPAHAEPANGNFWFVLERTSCTGQEIFTR